MTKKCQICDASYKYCPDCEKIDAYRKVVDKPDCYKIYLIIYEYRTNIIDKSKAKSEFESMGLTSSTIDKFDMIPDVRNYVAEIVKEDEIEVSETFDTESELSTGEYKSNKKTKKNK